MGSQTKEEEELTILVTGFGPFADKHPVNPSWEIAKGLPSSIAASKSHPAVRILVHPEPIHVGYTHVRGLVPALWDGQRRIDAAVHIGMAGPRHFYKLERRAHRRGYKSLDVDGKLLDDGDDGDKDWLWDGLPDELLSDLDIDDVCARWQGFSSPDMDLRISEDAGRYLCDFIYYSSLAHLLKQGKEKNVVFLHVPADATESMVTQGRELTVNLVRAIVESQVERGVKTAEE